MCRRLPAARGASSGVRESDKCIQVPETQTVRSGAPLATLKSIRDIKRIVVVFKRRDRTHGYLPILHIQY